MMVWRFSLGVFGLALLLTAPAKASLAAAACANPPASLGDFQTEQAGTPAPTDDFVIEDGQRSNLADYQGAGVVLNFWATWCAPCIEEMPALERLSESADPEALRVVTLSADRGGAPVVRRFFARQNLDSLPVALDEKSRLARGFGVLGLPTTVLLDPSGQEIGRVVGIAEWDHPETFAFLTACLADAS